MNKDRMLRHKSVAGLIIALFLFNYVSSKMINISQSYQPSAYNIATGSTGSFVTYIRSNWLTYGLTLITYLVVWLLLVTMVTTVMLYTWQMLSKQNYIKALKSVQIHFSVFIMIVLLIPLDQLGFKFPVAHYLTIPKTFIDPINQPIILVPVVAIYISILLLVYRLRRVSYLAITTCHSLGNNIKKSWQETRYQNGQFLLSIGRYLLGVFIVMGALFLLQASFDHILKGGLNRDTANMFIAVGIGYFYFATSQVFLLFIVENQKSYQELLRDRKWYRIVGNTVVIVLIGFASSTLSGKTLGQPIKNYIVIAHKGVSSENATANSIINLDKVASKKPDYVEIDIQKTRDGVYVLSHDAKIKAKNGKTYQIDDTPWHVLKNIRYEENGRTITATSFLEYIKRANQLQQKLLVELKINTTITTKQLIDFQNKYGQYLTKNKSQIQSMNQNAIKRLAKYSDRPIGLLSPVVNNVNGARFNTFYAIEYSNINTDISRKLVKYDKALYVWTLNKQADINTSYALGVKGYITDYPKETRTLLQKLSHHAVYANAVLHVVMLQKTNI